MLVSAGRTLAVGRDFTHSIELAEADRFCGPVSRRLRWAESSGSAKHGSELARADGRKADSRHLIGIVGQTSASQLAVILPLSQPEWSINVSAPGVLSDSVPCRGHALCAQHGSGNPVKYTDPSGHAPEWLDNVWSYASGASAQYLEDITLGAWSALVVKVDLDLVDSEAYQQGRETGRSVSTAQAEFEVATGIGAAIAGAAAAPITLGGGTLCAVGTAGLCAIPAGLALGAEGAMVVGGAATALHGGGVLLYAKGNPTGGGGSAKKYDRLTQHDIELLKKEGYDIHDLKGGKNASKYDLFKDKDGNIYQMPKDGSGPGEELDINLRELNR